MKIHPTAIIEDGAVLGADVEVGPYAFVGKDVKIGDGTIVKQGAIIDGYTTLGKECQIFPYAMIAPCLTIVPSPIFTSLPTNA